MCQDLQRNIGAVFTCSEQGDYQRIRTPYLYPDGGNIDSNPAPARTPAAGA